MYLIEVPDADDNAESTRDHIVKTFDDHEKQLKTTQKLTTSHYQPGRFTTCRPANRGLSEETKKERSLRAAFIASHICQRSVVITASNRITCPPPEQVGSP